MAQAFATMLGGQQVQTFSAGSKPSGKINPKAIASMNELGYDLSQHHSKSLEEVKEHAPFDVVVTMGCGDACPWMPAKAFVDWLIPDPKHMEPAAFNQVRDGIEQNVKDLLENVRYILFYGKNNPSLRLDSYRPTWINDTGPVLKKEFFRLWP